MRRVIGLFLLCAFLLPLPAAAQTRALLVACSSFVTQPLLTNRASGNLHLLGSALLGAQPALSGLSIEDSTIASPDSLRNAAQNAFSGAQEGDLSILYLCTHGVRNAAGQTFLVLSDGKTENTLSTQQLRDILSGIPGEKLLILDACFSGALLARAVQEDDVHLPGVRLSQLSVSPFLADEHLHVLTSAMDNERSWYYDSEHLTTGAVSYFASALCAGLGLYGVPEADRNLDGAVTLGELHSYLLLSVPSSTCQMLSPNADALFLPVSAYRISRPLSSFSFSASIVEAQAPVIDFSFTVTQQTGVQYRLVEYADGYWRWDDAVTFLDEGDTQDADLLPGRKQRTLTLPGVLPQDSGYLLLQVFSVQEQDLTLCGEKLLGVQPAQSDAQLSLSCPDEPLHTGLEEIPVTVSLGVPAAVTVSVRDADGSLVTRLWSGSILPPAAEGQMTLYWDGRDTNGLAVPSGIYTITADAAVCSRRLHAVAEITVML